MFQKHKVGILKGCQKKLKANIMGCRQEKLGNEAKMAKWGGGALRH